MDNRAVALKLILDYLGTSDISTVESRMEVQKAVYLVQSSGIPLGYSYGWYLKGPYSPGLTRDYYGLSEDVVPAGITLKPAAVQKLDHVRSLIAQPIGNLERPQRLELLASLHYLIKSSGFSEDVARARIATIKPHLARHTGLGVALLRGNNFL